jgi:hypothetical protein
MDFSSHEFRYGLVVAIPILIMSGFGILRRWLNKRNNEISATLQRRDE